MKLYSTLDKKVVDIEPIIANTISMYNCGPTVYSRMHIGNIRAYISWDILHRAWMYLGYDVKRVMNITDVGHMTHDEDFGDEKFDTQAAKEGVQPIDIANKYIDTVLDDFRKLNMLAPNGQIIPEDLTHENVSQYGWLRATEYVEEMIDIVKLIEANGYTYETKQAVYLDVTKFPDYTIFTGQKLEDKEVGVRDEVGVDPEKRHPADFVLWMKRVGKYTNHIMHWSSPWGDGFPGWHIECSAMGTSALGDKFDIHTGGIDHIPVHHPNERVQNIGAFNQPVVKYWIHNEWLVNGEGKKLSKSDGDGLSLPEVLDKGLDPLDVRYLFASINYRTKVQYSDESLSGARKARLSLLESIRNAVGENIVNDIAQEIDPEYKRKFTEALSDNLNVSMALAIFHELVGDRDISVESKVATILDFDRVFGLRIKEGVKALIENENVSIDDSRIEEYAKERDRARSEKNYQKADEFRKMIEDAGYRVIDTPQGTKYQKI